MRRGRGDEVFSQKLKHDPGQALVEAEGIITLAPDNANGWCLKGMALLELGRAEEAQQSFDKAIRLRPDLVEAWQGKGGSLLVLRRFDEALAALAKSPKTYLVCHRRGCALEALGRYHESMDALQEAISLNRDDRSILEQSRSLLEKISRRLAAPKAGLDARPGQEAPKTGLDVTRPGQEPPKAAEEPPARAARETPKTGLDVSRPGQEAVTPGQEPRTAAADHASPHTYNSPA